jgi:predicted RNase H-like nuclease (RuvC/YqgF family)
MSELPSRHPEALLEEIARLKADNARLKAEVEAQAKRWAESEDLISHYKEQRDEVINDCQCSRLKAEVERLDTLCKQVMAQHSDISCENIMLRKAGDAMASHLEWEFGTNPSTDAWNAAKEGKQSQ